MGRPLRRLQERHAQGEDRRSTPNVAIARAVHAPGLPRLPADDAGRLPGQDCSSTSSRSTRRRATFPNLVVPVPALRPHQRHAARLADAAGDGGRQRPGARAGRRGGQPRASSGRRRASSSSRTTRRTASTTSTATAPSALVDQPVHQAARSSIDQLQPDGHGEDDRADARPAADEPARPVGDADAQLLHGQAGPDAVHRGRRTASRSTR